MSLAKRLGALLKEKKLSGNALAKKVGLTQQSLWEITSGKTKQPRNIGKIAEVLGVDPGWLLFGEKTNDVQNISSYEIKQHVPLLKGEKIKEFCENMNKTLDKDTIFIGIQGKASDKTFALEVNGDSMTAPLSTKRSFFEGDIIIVDPTLKPENGSFIVININNEPTFIQYVHNAGKTYLKPLNPQYPTLEMNKKMEINGVVIQVISKV